MILEDCIGLVLGHSIELPKDDQIYGSGDNHYWGVWHGGDGFDAFEDNIGRFYQSMGCSLFQRWQRS